MLRTIVVVALPVLLVIPEAGTAQAPSQLALEAEHASAWLFDGSGAWVLGDGELELKTAGVVGDGIRRPSALAVLKEPAHGSLTLVAEVRSTADPGLQIADVLVVFGYEGPTRFFYVHLSGRTDAVHNGIFVVDDEDRRRIDAGTGVPQLTDREWHKVRLSIDVDAGRIEVFVDDASTPGLVAEHPAIPLGLVGFGSFDDTVRIRNVSVQGTAPS